MKNKDKNIEEVIKTPEELRIESYRKQYEEKSCEESIAFQKIMKTHIHKLKIEDLFMSHLTIPEVIAEMNDKLYEICINATYSKFANKDDFELLHSDIQNDEQHLKEYFFDDCFYDLILSPE